MPRTTLSAPCEVRRHAQSAPCSDQRESAARGAHSRAHERELVRFLRRMKAHRVLRFGEIEKELRAALREPGSERRRSVLSCLARAPMSRVS